MARDLTRNTMYMSNAERHYEFKSVAVRHLWNGVYPSHLYLGRQILPRRHSWYTLEWNW